MEALSKSNDMRGEDKNEGWPNLILVGISFTNFSEAVTNVDPHLPDHISQLRCSVTLSYNV